MKKYYRGSVVAFATGAVQFVRNNEAKKDFILITGRHGDLYVPVKSIEKALEDQWDADNSERSLRSHRSGTNLKGMNTVLCNCTSSTPDTCPCDKGD